MSHCHPPQQPTLMDTMKGLADTVRALRDQMRKKLEGNDDL